MMRWVRLADVGGAYTLQGGVVGAEGMASGVAVRPDRQTTQEILQTLESLHTHQTDYQLQRKLIPDWTLNRGGKTAADFRSGPGGIGITYAQAAIVVSEWIDVQHNEILLHPAVQGIVAEKGGATSHGVVVARERNIPIVVNIPDAKRIVPGDYLTVDAATGIISVNGGDPNFEVNEVIEAEEPIYAFVWENGQGLIDRIVSGSEGAVAVHTVLAMEGMKQGWFQGIAPGMGVIYESGKVQLFQRPPDRELMLDWLNETYPVTEVE